MLSSNRRALARARPCVGAVAPGAPTQKAELVSWRSDRGREIHLVETVDIGARNDLVDSGPLI